MEARRSDAGRSGDVGVFVFAQRSDSDLRPLIRIAEFVVLN